MRRFYLISFITFILILAINSCKPSVCENKRNLFLVSENVKMINFASLKSMKRTIKYLENIACKNSETALPIIYFDSKKSKIVDHASRNTFSLGIEPPPCGNIDFEYDFDKILEINLDGNNILIEGKLMPLDSVAQYVYYQYLNYGKRKGFSDMPDGNGMWLITKMKRPISDFEPIIAELIKGYIQTAEDFCEAIFDKKE